jgi:glycosyltransferase involved in cell wall biosynthesis
MKPIHVLALIEASTITGPAKNLLQFAQRVRQSQPESPVQVSIATFIRPGMSPLFVETVQKTGIPLFKITERRRFDSGVLSQLSALVRHVKPDVIQTHAVKSHFLVRLAELKRMAPWIAIHHGYTWPDWRMRLYNQLDRWSLRKADRVLTVSQAFRQDLIGKGISPRRIDVLHNSIDAHWLTAQEIPEAKDLRAQLGIPFDKKVILIVGRLSEEKDHSTLLRALRRLKTDSEDSTLKPHLIIVGDGSRRQELVRTAFTLGLKDAVTFVGQVPSAMPYYAIADLCVLSSLSEGSPNALLEAMAAKVPVVATAVGGVGEIVADEESALLVKPRDEVRMARAMARLLTQPDLASRLVVKAYQQVTTHHAPDMYMKRLIEFYEGVLTPPAAKSRT